MWIDGIMMEHFISSDNRFDLTSCPIYKNADQSLFKKIAILGHLIGHNCQCASDSPVGSKVWYQFRMLSEHEPYFCALSHKRWVRNARRTKHTSAEKTFNKNGIKCVYIRFCCCFSWSYRFKTPLRVISTPAEWDSSASERSVVRSASAAPTPQTFYLNLHIYLHGWFSRTSRAEPTAAVSFQLRRSQSCSVRGLARVKSLCSS